MQDTGLSDASSARLRTTWVHDTDMLPSTENALVGISMGGIWTSIQQCEIQLQLWPAYRAFDGVFYVRAF